ncbi:MAG: Dockerin type domain [Pseudomonadota bacterium]
MGLRRTSSLLLGVCALLFSTAASAQPVPRCLGDVNGDGQVNVNDMVSVLNAFGARGAAFKANVTADLYVDGLINGADLAIVQSRLGEPCSTCPHDHNNDGTVSAADLAYLLASGTATGTAMVSLLNDWGTNCTGTYAAPTKRNIRKSNELIQKRTLSKKDIDAARALAGTLR